MKRIVIYSALVGGYDVLLQPSIIDERFDYILFTNEITESKVGAWKIRPIEYYNKDNTRICRFVKTHPETLLPDYEISIWIDSNIQIMSSYFYDRIIELDQQNISISSMWHPTRHCIYEEAFACINMMVEHERVVVDWCHQLRKENYPRNNGLCETGVMYRKHQKPIIQKVDELWWNCIKDYSRRDQLSFNYVLWRLDIPCNYFLGEGLNARNTPHLRVVIHKDTHHNHCPFKKNEAWLMRHCWKKKEDSKKVEAIYYKLYAWPMSYLWIALVGQFYRIIDWTR